MKRTILRCIVFAVLIFSTVLISSCDNEPAAVNRELTITAIVENGNYLNEHIEQVRATSILFPIRDDIMHTPTVMRVVHTTGIFADGGFSITLPRTISEQYLSSFQGMYGEVEGSVNISNKNVRMASVDIEAWSSADDEWYWLPPVGSFIYGKINNSNSFTVGFYFYADRNAAIRGSQRSDLGFAEHYFEMVLKRGWNMVYSTVTHIEDDGFVFELSTNPISGLKWYFGEDFFELNDTELNPVVKLQMLNMPFLPRGIATKLQQRLDIQ